MEFQVNTYTTSDQRTGADHLVAANGNGGFVVVWDSDGQDGSSHGIFGQRYDSAGGVPQPVGSEFRVNSHTTGSQQQPSVASDASGNFVVVWNSHTQDGSDWGIFGQRYDSEGAARGAEFRVNSYTTGRQSSASVASDSNGNFVVVWDSRYQDGDVDGVFGQRYDSSGAALGSEFRVNSYTTDWQSSPSVASDVSGNFVVVWDGGYSPPRDDIFGQRYDSEGVARGEEFRVNSFTTERQVDASVAADASGNFVVVWASWQYGIFGQRYDSEGVAQGGEFRINTYTTAAQKDPSVASDASGSLFVVWESWAQDQPAGYGIFGQRYERDGVRHGHEFQVNSFGKSNQRHPSVGTTDEGQFAVVWGSSGQDGSDYGVFGQHFDLADDTIPPLVEVTAPNGGEKVFTGSSYLTQWTASDDTALSSFDVFVSVDGGGSFTPIAECQNLPDTATSCLWLAPGPPTASALVRVTAEDTSGNTASDDSDAVFRILSGTASVTVESPNSEVTWEIGSLHSIEWSHNLGLESTFRIELDREDDGVYERLIAAAEPADSATSGRFGWLVDGPHSAAARVRVSWTGNPAVSDSSDVTFQIRPSRGGLEFQINTYTTSSQLTSRVAANANGNFVVVWESLGQYEAGNARNIYAQRYESAGGGPQRLGSEFRVNSQTTGFQRNAAVASDASGNFVVVWQSFPQDGDSYGIFGQRYDSAGAAQGAEFQVNSFAGDSQTDPSVTSDASGNFVVVWRKEGSIYGQRYDSSGVALGNEFRVGSTRSSTPSVASDASGNFVVVWGTLVGYYGSPGDIFGQRYDSGGVAQGNEFRVNSYTTGPQSSASVASDASGNFVVVWSNSTQYVPGDIFGQRYDSGGAALGKEFRVNSYTASYQGQPSLAADAAGNFIVVWGSEGLDGDGYGVFAQRYDSTGVAQGVEFQINSFTSLGQFLPSVEMTGTNQFVVAWTSRGQDGDDDGVFGRRFDLGGAETITVVSPNTNVKWRIGSPQTIKWTHNLGRGTRFRIELDRDDDGSYEELIADAARADSPTRGHFAWTVTGPPSGTARIRVSWTDDLSVSDASDVTFEIRPVPVSATKSVRDEDVTLTH